LLLFTLKASLRSPFFVGSSLISSQST
jgi:hypothetical protein